ncbi:transmembrane protein 163-like [Nematostella vectensis]|uniref:transmembrane protein 163-like n=1 Tax=Nematostella vectensis TaxID=45351 RepID=UPI0020771740|nr:transmembrane protein 163-like [Nematostella vectensis]
MAHFQVSFAVPPGDKKSSRASSTSESCASFESSLMDAFKEGTQKVNNKDVVSFLDEDETERPFLSQKAREKWCRAAFTISILAIVISLLFSLSSFFVSGQTESSSVFASAFDSLLGTMSSVAVAWRFRDSKNGEIGHKRESIATLGIALSFITTGIATVATSVIHLTDSIHPRKPDEMLIVLTCSLLVFFVLAWVQNCIAKKVNSDSLRAAAVDYAMASAMAFGILISTYVYRENKPRLWWLDHSVALSLGAVSAAYGIYLVVQAEWCNSTILEEKSPLKH